MSLYEEMQNVRNQKDFILFLNHLSQDAEQHPQEWETLSVPEYLEHVSAWVADYPASPANRIDWNHPDWNTIALLFYMGKIYE